MTPSSLVASPVSALDNKGVNKKIKQLIIEKEKQYLHSSHDKQLGEFNVRIKNLETADITYRSKPPGYFWWALFLAVTTFFWNIFLFFYNKVKNRNEIIDEYWVRNIALPICVNPLIEFVETYSAQLKALNLSDKSNMINYENDLKGFQKEFKDEKEFIIKKFFVLSIKWNEIFNVLSKQLDELDDAITMHCYVNQKISNSDARQIAKYSINEDVFYTTLARILADLSELHSSEIK